VLHLHKTHSLQLNMVLIKKRVTKLLQRLFLWKEWTIYVTQIIKQTIYICNRNTFAFVFELKSNIGKLDLHTVQINIYCFIYYYKVLKFD